MENFVIIVITTLIIGGIVWYLVKAKKKGETCIGCPHAKECHKHKHSVMNESKKR